MKTFPGGGRPPPGTGAGGLPAPGATGEAEGVGGAPPLGGGAPGIAPTTEYLSCIGVTWYSLKSPLLFPCVHYCASPPELSVPHDHLPHPDAAGPPCTGGGRRPPGGEGTGGTTGDKGLQGGTAGALAGPRRSVITWKTLNIELFHGVSCLGAVF